MPHDLPPSWLDQRPNLRRAFYVALALAVIGTLVWLFGPEWVRDKLDLLINYYLGSAPAITNGG